MKDSLITLLLTVVSFSAYSLEYEYVPMPDSGAVWSEVYFHEEPYTYPYPDDWVPYTYERFTVNGEDTVIDGISYKKLFVFYDSVFNKANATCVGGIRENEKKVYFKGESIHDYKPIYPLYDEEMLIFDFSVVSIGDTVKYLYGWDGIPQVVTDIDTIKIKETLRRKITIEGFVTWIEGIGDGNKGLVYSSMFQPTSSINNKLICFKQNGELLYHNLNSYYTECFPVTTDIKYNTINSSEIMVTPNPSTDYIRFSFGNTKINDVLITDINGKIYNRFSVNMGEEYIYNVDEYSPGIYLYKATDGTGVIYTGKFVVE